MATEGKTLKHGKLSGVEIGTERLSGSNLETGIILTVCERCSDF
jgi:hypothetical protein